MDHGLTTDLDKLARTVSGRCPAGNMLDGRAGYRLRRAGAERCRLSAGDTTGGGQLEAIKATQSASAGIGA